MSRTRKPTRKDLSRISPDLQKLPLVWLTDLVLDPNNARLHPGRNLESIKASLKEYGQRENIVVNKHGHVVEAGNGRVEAALDLGWRYMAVSYEDDSTQRASAYGLTANRTAELAMWDERQLHETLTRLDEDGVDIDDIGFNEHEMQDLLARLHPSEPEPLTTPEPIIQDVKQHKRCTECPLWKEEQS